MSIFADRIKKVLSDAIALAIKAFIAGLTGGLGLSQGAGSVDIGKLFGL